MPIRHHHRRGAVLGPAASRPRCHGWRRRRVHSPAAAVRGVDLGAGHAALRVVAPEPDGGPPPRSSCSGGLDRVRRGRITSSSTAGTSTRSTGSASARRSGTGLSLVWHIIREPRRVAAMIPPTVRHGIALFEREWREDLQPRYRAAIAAAARSVEVTPPSQLPMLVDELADLAGEYFASVAALSGAAYKMEMNLAIFYRRHIAKTIGGSHLPLVAGFDIPSGTAHPAIASMDWWFEPAALARVSSGAGTRSPAGPRGQAARPRRPPRAPSPRPRAASASFDGC